MVSIIENWSRVTGTVEAIDDAAFPGFTTVDLSVNQVEPVGSFPNLLNRFAGQKLTVRLPKAKASTLSLTPGAAISLRARLAPGNVAFAHPDE
jgi:hypothetical protein